MGAGHAHALYVHEHSPIHRSAPEVKLIAVLAFVAAAAVTPVHATPAFAFYACVVVGAVLVARMPWRFFMTRLAAVVPFLLFALLIPFAATGERIDVGWFTVSREGLLAARGIFAKALIGAGASIVLVGTTEVPAILTAMRSLKVPTALVSIAGFMIRYLELIAEEWARMRQAMAARGYAPRWLWQARPAAAATGAMFVRAYERGERVHAAMIARGYQGDMPPSGRLPATPSAWALGLIIPTVAWVVAIAAMVTW